MKYPYEPTDYVGCSCCGATIENTPAQNVYLLLPDDEPYPCDDGYGMCRECGGDPDAEVSDDEQETRRALGYAQCVFYDARIPKLRNALSEDKRVKFDAFPYWKKCRLVQHAVTEGLMI